MGGRIATRTVPPQGGHLGRTRSAGLRDGALRAVVVHLAVRALSLATLAVAALVTGRSARAGLAGWDGGWYVGIARHGYGLTHVHPDGRHLSDYAFFPLYPALERFLATVTGLPLVDAGLLISLVASPVAVVAIYRIARTQLSPRGALLVVVLWSALPFSFVESMAYSESLYTALSAWALLLAIGGRFWAAGLLAALAGATRPVGVAVVLAVVAAALWDLVGARRGRPASREAARPSRRHRAGAAAGVLVAPLGTLSYLAFVSLRTGHLLGYGDVTRDWGNRLDGGVAFVRWTRDLLHGPHWYLGIGVCLALGLLLWSLASTVKAGYPLPVLVFTVASLVLAFAMSGYFGSRPRYLLPVFPLLMPLAGYLSTQRRRPVDLSLALLAAASAVYGAWWVLFSTGPP